MFLHAVLRISNTIKRHPLVVATGCFQSPALRLQVHPSALFGLSANHTPKPLPPACQTMPGLWCAWWICQASSRLWGASVFLWAAWGGCLWHCGPVSLVADFLPEAVCDCSTNIAVGRERRTAPQTLRLAGKDGGGAAGSASVGRAGGALRCGLQ